MRASATDPISAIPDDCQFVPVVAFATAVGIGAWNAKWLLREQGSQHALQSAVQRQCK
jgi:hypothetical protein